MKGDELPYEDVVKTVKQFMEQSTLGDFQARLDMLLTFHCQVVTLADPDTQQDKLLTDADRDTEVAIVTRIVMLRNLLWNLYHFYAQFSSIVKTQLEKLRQPIEKELKVTACLLWDTVV